MRWFALLAVALTACSIERAGLGPGDAARRDDAAVLVDAAASRDDGGSPDASHDAGSPASDAGRDDPDAGRPTPCDPAAVGLIGCWTFDGHLMDGSGRENHAYGTEIGYAAGVRGQALELGPSSSVNVPYRDAFDVDRLTVELYARLDALPASGRTMLMDKDGAYGVYVYPDGDVVCAVGATVVRAGSRISAEEWIHVACTFDGARTSVWVDGTHFQWVDGGAVPRLDSPILIGENGPGGDDQLVGRVDELRIFERALSDAELRARPAR